MDISKEKKELLEKLCSKYYERNFGNISKNEIDLIMFHYYLEERKNNREDCSDYSISKALGISQIRVRNLKQKDYLLNPPAKTFNIKESFIKLLETGRIVDGEEKIEMYVKDVNLMMELRHFLEDHNCYDDYTLNPKILKCSFEFIIKIGELLDEKTGENSTFKELKEIIDKRSGKITPCKNIKELITTMIDDLSEVSTTVNTAKTIGKCTQRFILTLSDMFYKAKK